VDNSGFQQHDIDTVPKTMRRDVMFHRLLLVSLIQFSTNFEFERHIT